MPLSIHQNHFPPIAPFSPNPKPPFQRLPLPQFNNQPIDRNALKKRSFKPQKTTPNTLQQLKNGTLKEFEIKSFVEKLTTNEFWESASSEEISQAVELVLESARKGTKDSKQKRALERSIQSLFQDESDSPLEKSAPFTHRLNGLCLELKKKKSGKPGKWTRFKQFVKKHKVPILIGLGVTVAVGVVALIILLPAAGTGVAATAAAAGGALVPSDNENKQTPPQNTAPEIENTHTPQEDLNRSADLTNTLGANILQTSQEDLLINTDQILATMPKTSDQKIFENAPLSIPPQQISAPEPLPIKTPSTIPTQTLKFYDNESAAAFIQHQLIDFNDNGIFTKKDFMSQSRAMTVGEHELPNKRIAFVNGILNTPAKFEKSAIQVSEMAGGAKVHGVYNATHGLVLDKKESDCLLNYVSTPPVEIMKNEILDYFQEQASDKKMLLVCHSQGTAVVRNALIQLPDEIRQRISVIGVAPLGYIDEALCGDIKHLVSDKDYVPNIDHEGRARCANTIVVLKSLATTVAGKMMDHSFDSPTYDKPLKMAIEAFNETEK